MVFFLGWILRFSPRRFQSRRASSVVPPVVVCLLDVLSPVVVSFSSVFSFSYFSLKTSNSRASFLFRSFSSSSLPFSSPLLSLFQTFPQRTPSFRFPLPAPFSVSVSPARSRPLFSLDWVRERFVRFSRPFEFHRRDVPFARRSLIRVQFQGQSSKPLLISNCDGIIKVVVVVSFVNALSSSSSSSKGSTINPRIRIRVVVVVVVVRRRRHLVAAQYTLSSSSNKVFLQSLFSLLNEKGFESETFVSTQKKKDFEIP